MLHIGMGKSTQKEIIFIEPQSTFEQYASTTICVSHPITKIAHKNPLTC